MEMISSQFVQKDISIKVQQEFAMLVLMEHTLYQELMIFANYVHFTVHVLVGIKLFWMKDIGGLMLKVIILNTAIMSH
jgi:hypothetical protein